MEILKNIYDLAMYIQYIVNLILHAYIKKKTENRKTERKKGRVGLGEVWGKPGIRSNFTVHLGNIWMFDSGALLLK